MDWRCGSSCRTPTFQVQSPKFKPSITKKKKRVSPMPGSRGGEWELELTGVGTIRALALKPGYSWVLDFVFHHQTFLCTSQSVLWEEAGTMSCNNWSFYFEHGMMGIKSLRIPSWQLYLNWLQLGWCVQTIPFSPTMLWASEVHKSHLFCSLLFPAPGTEEVSCTYLLTVE
jgi:hypothetical protein